MLDKEIELQKIQTLSQYYHSERNSAILWLYGVLVAFIAVLFAIYYELLINQVMQLSNAISITIGVVVGLAIVLGFYLLAPELVERHYNSEIFLNYLDNQFSKVERCEPLPSMLEMQKELNRQLRKK